MVGKLIFTCSPSLFNCLIEKFNEELAVTCELVYCRIACPCLHLEDVIRVLHCIEPTVANYGTYGAVLVKVFLSICSEIAVAFKDLDHLVRRYESADWGAASNICGSRQMVHARFPEQFRFSWAAIGASEIVINPRSS